MWPMLLDLTKEESIQCLRNIELDAFAGLVSAFRAQGSLSTEKLTLLKETGIQLRISQDRHKAEIRRAVNDERLSTIAYHITGNKSVSDDWIQEGRRLIPLLPRVTGQTMYSVIADETANRANRLNNLLPHPATTARKRCSSTPPASSQYFHTNTNDQILMNPHLHDIARYDNIVKRRKVDNGFVPILSKPQLMPSYRYRPKLRNRDNLHLFKTRPHVDSVLSRNISLQTVTRSNQGHINPTLPEHTETSLKRPQFQVKDQSTSNQQNELSCRSIPQEPKVVNITTHAENSIESTESSTSTVLSTESTSVTLSEPSDIGDLLKSSQQLSVPVQPPRFIRVPRNAGLHAKTTVTTTTGQKLLVVTNPQGATANNSGLLQRTLTIPFVKNIAVKNCDKFKIVPNSISGATSTVSSANCVPMPANIASIQIPNSLKTSAAKHRVVTLRTNGSSECLVTSGKKTIPLQQIHMINSRGTLKVMPISSKLASANKFFLTNPISRRLENKVSESPGNSEIFTAVDTSKASNDLENSASDVWNNDEKLFIHESQMSTDVTSNTAIINADSSLDVEHGQMSPEHMKKIECVKDFSKESETELPLSTQEITIFSSNTDEST